MFSAEHYLDSTTRPETRFTLVVTLLLVSAVLTLALLVYLPRHIIFQ